MPILMFILPLLKKFWLSLTILFTLLGVLWYTYHRGEVKCQEKVNNVIAQQQLKSETNIEQVFRRGSDVLTDITIAPSDKKDSCILSNNPITKDCTL